MHSAAPSEQHLALPSSRAAVRNYCSASTNMHSSNRRRLDVKLNEISYPVVVILQRLIMKMFTVVQDFVLKCENLVKAARTALQTHRYTSL